MAYKLPSAGELCEKAVRSGKERLYRMEIRKTAVFGMGALGLLFGSQIADKAGSDAVTFLMDPERLKRHSGDVYTINDAQRHFRMEDASLAKPYDLVLVAVKYGTLKGVIEEMKPAVGPDTVIVSVMNGITSEDILAETFPRRNIIDCVAIGMDAMRDGTSLHYTKPGKLQIGVTVPSQQGAYDRLVRFLDRVRIPYEPCENIRWNMWNKFMLNVGINQACTVYETDYFHATEKGPILDEMVEAMEEVIRVAEAEGVKLTREDLERCVALERTLKPDGYPSMRQDAVAKRPTEVDMFAGTVMELGQKHGIPTPVNRKYYDAVKKMEQSWSS